MTNFVPGQTRRNFMTMGAGLCVANALPVVADEMPVSLKQGYAGADGVKLFYRQAGEGPLMICLHGIPGDGTRYRHQIREFSRDHLVVAPNLRGVLPSDQPQAVEAYRMSHHLRDIHRMIDYFNRDDCVLVANDWGGWFAWIFASAYPERVKQLVIMNAAHPAVYLRDVMQNTAQIAVSQYERDAVKAPAEGSTTWVNYVQADPIRVPASLTEAVNMPVPDLAAHYFADLDDYPPATRSLKIERPTLAIWGMRDSPMLPSLLDGLEDYVADLTIHRIENAGHFPMEQRPNEVNRVMRQFLNAA